jgi:hypothetical protein
MNEKKPRRRLWVLALILGVTLSILLGAKAGSFLVMDTPKPSDVILVLAGEADHRPERALQLLVKGYAPRMVLDVPTNTKIYEFTQIQLAEKYVHDLPQRKAIRVCPIQGLSTRDEAKDVQKCFGQATNLRVLIVTSDFHTRRALSIFQHEIPGYVFNVAAAWDEEQFGERWWTHRQWAKTFLYEWFRLLWWRSVDRWRENVACIIKATAMDFSTRIVTISTR